MADALWRLNATDLVAAMRIRAVSSRDIVQAHLDRIAAVNPSLNALPRILAEDALAAADAADRRLAQGEAAGPLHGLPITVKENIDLAGAPTTQGIVALKDWMPPGDAPLVRFLKDAGAIVIGRSNMPDYGCRWHTDNDLHGPTLNPWDKSRTPGGSSGGEAAALATGMTPLGIGNDMGGSTRQPALCCGVAGLRPSTGRVSRHHSAQFTEPPGDYGRIAYVNGPMARRIADLRLALRVMERRDPTDPVWTRAEVPPDPAASARMTVGLVRDPSGRGVDPPVAAALKIAGQVLQDRGYTVAEIDAPLLAETDRTIERLAASDFSGPSDLPPASQTVQDYIDMALGAPLPADFTYDRALETRQRIGTAWAELMETYPLIVGPVSTLNTFPVGFDLEGRETVRALIASFRLTEVCNLLGLPSVAVPVLIENGLPQGVQIIGRRFDDDRCLDAAAAIEDACPMPTPIDPV